MTSAMPNPFNFGGSERLETMTESEISRVSVAAGSPLERILSEVLALPAILPPDDDPPPAFLSNPSPEYLRATEIEPILHVLAGHVSGVRAR